MHGKTIVTSIVTVLLMAVAGPVLADAGTYTIDLAHSGVEFKVRHMLVTNVKGEFDQFEGTIRYDPDNIERSSVEVTIQTSSVNTQNEKRDNDVKGPEFLAVTEFPAITFKSKSIEKTADGLVAIGDLTIRGVTKEVRIPFEVAGPAVNPWGQTVIGAAAEIEINRQDYGVSWNKKLDNGGLVVSDMVKIELNVEASQKKDS